MNFDKVTNICLVSCTALGAIAGYEVHQAPPPVPAVSMTSADTLTARRIVSTVTKYVHVPVPGSTKFVTVKDSVTHTVFDKPKETHNDSVSILPVTPPLSRYALGLGCISYPCGSLSALELQGAVRLGNWPIHIYTSFRPATTSISIGVNYEF